MVRLHQIENWWHGQRYRTAFSQATRLSVGLGLLDRESGGLPARGPTALEPALHAGLPECSSTLAGIDLFGRCLPACVWLAPLIEERLGIRVWPTVGQAMAVRLLSQYGPFLPDYGEDAL